MGFTIAVTGKGGTGKSTIAALIVSELIRNRRTPVLAVDADPNSCLDSLLGVSAINSIGGVREETRRLASAQGDPGISKRELLELKISECLVESDSFDLIAMGRPEGPGCYCYANNVLGAVIRELSASYPYVVIDNEAGLENLSRRIVSRVDLLVMVADPSVNGLRTLRRLYALAGEMGIEYSSLVLAVNRLRAGVIPRELDTLKQETSATAVVCLPADDMIAESGERGSSLLSLPAGNEVSVQIAGMLNTVLPQGDRNG
jgi:CO dehydrogenase maturation factor